MAARIIDPAKGASTCALGNHRCSVKIGIFTKNAAIVKIHQIARIWLFTGASHKDINIKSVWFLCKIRRSLIRNGSEAVTVYKIRYMEACNRSG